MKNIKVAISAPVNDNIYSLLVTQLCILEPGVKVVGVYALKLWSLKRIFNEFRRLRWRLLIKIWKKFFSSSSTEDETIDTFELLKNKGLEELSLESLCLKRNIPFKYFNDPNDNQTIKFLNEEHPDIILSIGSVILKEQFLDIPNLGTLNVHMGILPEYRGIGVTEWPILEANSVDDIKIGISLHLVERGVDTGPIILRKNITIETGDTIEAIEDKFLPHMVDAMLTGVKLARDNKLDHTKEEQSGKGKQYYFLHPRLKRKAKQKLKRLINEY